MIPVTLQPEPDNFDEEVRQPGLTWLNNNSIPLHSEPPTASELPNYWTKTNKILWDSYSGVCAYLAIFFEWSTGASSTDHFVAKSRNAGSAYEWSNYRLSCLATNRNKNKFDDILDPVGLKNDVFVINLSSGAIAPNQNLNDAEKVVAAATIERLKLDSPENRKMRANHYSEYLHKHCSLDFLRRKSPFVHYEIRRQGLS